MLYLFRKLLRKQTEKRQQLEELCGSFYAKAKNLIEAEKAFYDDPYQRIENQQVERWREETSQLIHDCRLTGLRKFRHVKSYNGFMDSYAKLKELVSRSPEKVTSHNDFVVEIEKCLQLTAEIDTIFKNYKVLFDNMEKFIELDSCTPIANQLNDFYDQYHNFKVRKINRTEQYDTLCKRSEIAAKLRDNIYDMAQQHNKEVAHRHAAKCYALIGDVEGRKLDDQQLNCIAREAHNHLVIAGAGTGKTTTVIGKIKYLLRSGKCKPENILVLSFTNASASEMCQRIRAETGVQIQASTFHKLGLQIIAKTDKIMPKITQINLRDFVKVQIQKLMHTSSYLKRMSLYLLNCNTDSKSEFAFSSKAEYDKHIAENPPTTLKKELVKSYGEMDIANFLAYNGISYIYEHPYLQDTRTEEYAQYYPDFYLPDYNIYIEYFGINRNGEVPPYFSGKNGKNAMQTYQESMAWKRKVHEENQTTLISCYAYEHAEGVLILNLERQLAACGVAFHEIPAEDLWKQISGEEPSKIIDSIAELTETVINLLKSNQYSISDLLYKADQADVSRSVYDLIALIEPIYDAYNKYLTDKKEIDFNDMINLAAEYIRNGSFKNPYTYVIVDEYQDISCARYRLLQELRRSQDYDLFCVGDDWQSIYRFAGSDIGFILNFSKYWGLAEESKIETTYRFTQSLIEISGNFIMQNSKQKRKEIRGAGTENRFALSEVSGYTEKFAAQFLTQKLDDLPKNSTVFMIGRYSFDVNILKESGVYNIQYDNQAGMLSVEYPQRPDLKMYFITAHKSKGLQADYVVILNNKSSNMGFPSKIHDSPVLNLLLDNSDDYPFGEERRLFYVALTRAKKKAFLLTVKDRESVFVQELRMRYAYLLRKEQFECPLCGGKLIRKHGKYGDFFGCANYATKGCRYTRNINSKQGKSNEQQNV